MTVPLSHGAGTIHDGKNPRQGHRNAYRGNRKTFFALAELQVDSGVIGLSLVAHSTVRARTQSPISVTSSAAPKKLSASAALAFMPAQHHAVGGDGLLLALLH